MCFVNNKYLLHTVTGRYLSIILYYIHLHLRACYTVKALYIILVIISIPERNSAYVQKNQSIFCILTRRLPNSFLSFSPMAPMTGHIDARIFLVCILILICSIFFLTKIGKFHSEAPLSNGNMKYKVDV